ncbi:MAG TPA: hypothetical protein PK514_04915 [Spirochaetota bacterium]|nr:hypothetical protein [Spirochaetota bacterium]
MEEKYKMAAAFHIIPALINISGSVYIFSSRDMMKFSGYVIGTVLGIILSVIWLLQVKEAMGTHALKLIKITFKAFLVKILFFFIFIIGVYNLFKFSRSYFAMAFFIAVFISAVIELWFYASISKKN